jgi:anti-sigma B factor antagonist
VSAVHPGRRQLSDDPGGIEVEEVPGYDGVVCFAVAGEIDISTAPRLPVQVRDALRAGKSMVCLDLTDVSFIDSTGLAALLHCGRSVARADGRMVVVADEGEVLRLFELSRLDRALDVHPSREAALAALAAQDGASSDGAGG